MMSNKPRGALFSVRVPSVCMRKAVTGLVISYAAICSSVAAHAQQAARDYVAERAQVDMQISAFINLPLKRSSNLPMPQLDPALVSAAMSNGENIAPQFTFVIAHRGEHTEPGFSENGIGGIFRAYESGADGIELDVKRTLDNVPVLGHDFTVGRELADWVGKTSGFDVLKYFPSIDPVYNNGLRWPFRTDKTADSVANLNRGLNPFSSIKDQPLMDQYDLPQRSQDGSLNQNQLTVYQSLYAVGQYAPMMPWLDVKNVTDLSLAVSDLSQARADLNNPSVLATVGLKITSGALQALSAPFNPSATYGVLGLKYFVVVGTNDLAALEAGGADPYQRLTNEWCVKANGCIGVELSHKYSDAPTAALFQSLKMNLGNLGIQLAGFHTVPQYDWAAAIETSSSSEHSSQFANRWFPRTDGSCCFALEDAFNVKSGTSHGDLNSEAEITDWRASYEWNTDSFTTITTDDSSNILRMLDSNFKRASSEITRLGGNASYPSGGDTQLRDGLVMLQLHSGPSGGECYVNILPDQPSFEKSCTTPDWQNVLPARGNLFWLTAQGPYEFTLTSVRTGQLLGYVHNGGPAAVELIDRANAYQSNTAWYTHPNSGVPPVKLVTFNLEALDATTYPHAAVQVLTLTSAGPGRDVTIKRVGGPIFEDMFFQPVGGSRTVALGEETVPPTGSTYLCAEGDLDCDPIYRKTSTRYYFGYGASDTNLVYRDLLPSNGPQTVECTEQWFSASPPTHSQKRLCYQSPLVEAPLGTFYQHLVDEGQPIPSSVTNNYSIAYGATVNGKWEGVYLSAELLREVNGGQCANFDGIDPAPNTLKACYSYHPDKFHSFGRGYAACKVGLEDDCSFTAPHYGVLQYFDPASSNPNPKSVTYKTFQTGFVCDWRQFGIAQPPANYESVCFARPVLSSDNAPVGYALCAHGGLNCKTAGTVKMPAAYINKAQGIEAYKLIDMTSGLSCVLSSFVAGATDPDQSTANCFVRLY